ncbi:MAG: assimilatory sulfite reductase (NADPH) flavoprotein subunit [Opitutaceae bacterium]|nr:assimilatory sulfite reductase (NADPH) flavoprotein subunit [Opitutaceae bacterium]
MSTQSLDASNSPLDPAQVTQVNQLAAQLSPAQLNWVAGYLTGLGVSGQGAVASEAAVGDSKLTILYGSQTGNAQGVAAALFEEAKRKNLPAELVSMGDFKPKQLKSTTHLALLASTHGEGDPPDDAEFLHELLGSKKAPKLDGLKYAVLAFGDTSYEFFCQTGKDFDERLAQCGAERMLDRVDLDVEFEDQAKAWNSRVCDTFAPLVGQSRVPAFSQAGAAVAQPPPSVEYDKNNPYEATLLVGQKITGRNSVKDIRHIEIDLSDSGIRYQPGDALGVFFKNDPKLVADVLKALEIDPEEKVGEQTAEEALLESFELTKLHSNFVKQYAEAIDSAALKEITSDKAALKAYAADRQLADVVKQNPAQLEAGAFFSLLRKLTPRLYSIASSKAEVDEEVHLTVAVVEYEAHGETHLGGASGYLCRRLQDGGTVKVFVKGNDNFRLPADPSAPIIMIGPGTGIAPFRAFLQERVANGVDGDSWLFFGAPNFTEDFLYQTELQDYFKRGQLKRLDLAFSRDQDYKIYVQDRLRERSEELWEWIERGAHIYVCGDATRMAKDVQDALLAIFQERGKLSPEKASEFLKQLRRDKRYQRDVY